jgi:hypothetical protein
MVMTDVYEGVKKCEHEAGEVAIGMTRAEMWTL